MIPGACLLLLLTFGNCAGQCAPLTIAADILDVTSFETASYAAFGAQLCDDLTTASKDISKQSDVQGLPLFWAATMLAAIYKGYGAHWHVASYAAVRYGYPALSMATLHCLWLPQWCNAMWGFRRQRSGECKQLRWIGK